MPVLAVLMFVGGPLYRATERARALISEPYLHCVFRAGPRGSDTLADGPHAALTAPVSAHRAGTWTFRGWVSGMSTQGFSIPEARWQGIG
jgi:hypothetical protein